MMMMMMMAQLRHQSVPVPRLLQQTQGAGALQRLERRSRRGAGAGAMPDASGMCSPAGGGRQFRQGASYLYAHR